MPHPRTVLALHGVIAVSVLAVACSSGHVKAGPLPVFDVVTTTSTTAFDFSSVQVAGVQGRAVVKVAMGPGQATLNGTVTGPSGPVPGADVHVERIVDGFIGTADVATLADGTWTLPNVLGGEFRIRAWLAPDLSLTTPSLVFIG
ncbi:MAG TPA: carboxypeptidase-like regulatory domain-containing protein, partial [Acidimicrobiales bacterium]|nr:carboxypeptidase-like regulatory domain-containing protein [Acidimicrobiales bacterium]